MCIYIKKKNKKTPKKKPQTQTNPKLHAKVLEILFSFCFLYAGFCLFV